MKQNDSTQQTQTAINTNQSTEHKPSTLLIPKITIDFKQPISHFFYYQNYIICKGNKNIIVYHTSTKKQQIIKVKSEDFVVKFMPPYLFVLIQGQYLKLYDENYSSQNKNVLYIKISKMEPRAICRYNKGYFMGGYNKSILPGNKRTQRRQLYYIQKLNFEDKNIADYVIKLKNSDKPVSQIIVQNPYLIAYCMPIFYLINIFSREILITFEKEVMNFILIEGRFSMSCMNGIGISQKNTIFTFDVENFPLYGIQVSQHLYTTQCLCLEKTGRIFGGHGNLVFEYNPIKRHSKCWTMYPENDFVISISCTPNNSLMVLRHSLKGGYFIDIFGFE